MGGAGGAGGGGGGGDGAGGLNVCLNVCLKISNNREESVLECCRRVNSGGECGPPRGEGGRKARRKGYLGRRSSPGTWIFPRYLPPARAPRPPVFTLRKHFRFCWKESGSRERERELVRRQGVGAGRRFRRHGRADSGVYGRIEEWFVLTFLHLRQWVLKNEPSDNVLIGVRPLLDRPTAYFHPFSSSTLPSFYPS